ncbi:MAG: hypothetical protein QXT64_02845 [Desulfurococcaceae archaeon]
MRFELLGVYREGEVLGHFTEMVPGMKYEVEVVYRGKAEAERIRRVVREAVEERFPVEVEEVKVKDGVIRMVIVPKANVVWAEFLPFLPTILGLLGLAMVLAVVLYAVSVIPSWGWVLLFLGLILLLLGGRMGERVTATA